MLWLVTTTVADAPEVISLWPEGPPTRIEGVPGEVEFPVSAGLAAGGTFLRNVSEPTLTVFAPQGAGNGMGIIIVPGGGWTINAWTHEGLDVAGWLTSLGYTAFLLKYRLRATDPDQQAFEAMQAAIDEGLAAGLAARLMPGAISDLIGPGSELEPSYLEARAACADDGRRAIELVREQAGRFGINPATIGMIGFSAGAFLIVDVALDPRAEQVAYIAPIYGGETRGAPVPADAPPMFAAAARDDILIKIVEGVVADWTAANRSAELHVFARGQHGFGLVKQGLPSDRWTDLFTAWLADLDLAGRA
jgi:acetyl esterase/lipase